MTSQTWAPRQLGIEMLQAQSSCCNRQQGRGYEWSRGNKPSCDCCMFNDSGCALNRKVNGCNQDVLLVMTAGTTELCLGFVQPRQCK
mmetsp:Transcript_26492/g.48511  ORF Transcript_26492/g.48511 Transcript_26492/m.48511 type:complete len:87 (-) Transcript_26492:62-322(-)